MDAAAAPLATLAAAPVVPLNTQGTLALYVGNLAPDVAEEHLFSKFSEIGRVTSVRVCRDLRDQRSLGYGFVNFTNAEDAKKAIEAFNHEDLKGRPMRIMHSQRNPSLRKSGVGNIYISNLHKDIDDKALHDTFATYGSVLSSKVSCDINTGASRGYGFVHYATEEDAKNAIQRLDGADLSGQVIRVYAYKTKLERQQEMEQKFVNVFVKHLPASWTKKELDDLFQPFGAIKRSTVRADEKTQKSKGFGFVEFEQHESAAKAVQELNDRVVEEGAKLLVTRALKKSERLDHLRRNQMQRVKHEGENLYVKNLDDDFTEEQMRKLFEQFGVVKSVRIMMDGTRSKGFGFVSFETLEEAAKAISELSGKHYSKSGKPMFVAKHQTKEERNNQLRMRYQQQPPHMGGMGMGMGMYSAPPYMMQFPAAYTGYPGRPGRPAPGMMQPGRFPVQYRQQNMSMAPMGSMGMGGRPARPANPLHYASNQPNQMPVSRGRIPAAAAPSMLEPLNASALASMPPQDQKQAIGERLYPDIEKRHGSKAGKITGMLLEMDVSELLHLLEDPNALMTKEQEALRVLQNSNNINK